MNGFWKRAVFAFRHFFSRLFHDDTPNDIVQKRVKPAGPVPQVPAAAVSSVSRLKEVERPASEAFDRALATVAGRLPRAVRIVAVSEGRIDPAALLGLGVGTEDDIANRRTRHDEEPDHDHDDFDSFVVPLPEVADPAALAKRVAGLADTHNVFRVKGFAAVAGKPMRLLVQAVGARVSQQYDRAWTASDGRHGRLVVIGLKGLDRAGVTRALLG